MHLRPFSSTGRRAEKPFETIHSDLKEFPVTSYHKYKYTIVFFDNCTSYGWNTHLKTKDAAFNAIKQFIAMVERQFPSYKILNWMSDGGGEYRSGKLDEFFKDKGIKALYSAPYIHQQSGHAERFIRTTVDKGETMRFQACLPESWWEFSINHAVHVYNRTPIRRLEWKTPYEALHGSVPRIDHLRVLGCGAYVFLHEDVRKNKLAPKSELMTYLGTSDGGHGNIFMRENNSMFTAAHALFDENLFP
ncbi:ribonuclease H-like protein, partial [Stereum hirsutum FP-91666 SS1]|uniref:ribonuclease H-like protein n=1 Tax=Stereum hirsutum (strain FP-91666) TaxID=721885 RepID=UPI000440FAF0